MRIISGRWKSRKFIAVKGLNTRPTSDRVKEAVFNIIRDRLDGSVVLDVLAGTEYGLRHLVGEEVGQFL